MKPKILKLKDLNGPIIAFASDAEVAEDNLEKDSSQYNRRVFVRSLFGFIEGTIYFLKQTAYSTGLSLRNIDISYAILLQDFTIELKSNGIPSIRTKFLKLEDNIKFAFKSINKVYELKIDIGVGTENWNHFKKAIEVRNRLMHPKDAEDFQISDQEIEEIKATRDWFCQLIADAVQGIASQLSVLKNRIQGTLLTRH
jgi:hypothetical protein